MRVSADSAIGSGDESETLASVNVIAATLAEVSEQIIGSLRSPGFLDHLCRLTAEALACDQSHTLLFRPADDVFEVIAGSGESAEEREAGRIVRVPRVHMAVLLERLEHDEVALVGSVPPDYTATAAPSWHAAGASAWRSDTAGS